MRFGPLTAVYCLSCLVVLSACGAASSTAPGGASPVASPAVSSAAAKPSFAPASVASTAAKPSAAAVAAGSAPAATDINWSTVPVYSNIPGWTAKDRGFDKSYGVNILPMSAPTGAPSMQQLQAGQVQVASGGLSTAIAGNAAGGQFRAVMSLANQSPFYMMGARGITAENAATKLKGGKIGITAFGSEAEPAAILYLQTIGLQRDKDVALIQTGNLQAELAALISGSVDAAPLTLGEKTAAERQGLQVLLDMTKAPAPAWIASTNQVIQPYLASHHDAVLDFAKAWAEGGFYARSHPDDAKKIIARELKTSDAEVIGANYTGWTGNTPNDLRPSDDGIKNVVDFTLKARNLTISPSDAASAVDFSIVDELQKSGFLASLKQKYGVS